MVETVVEGKEVRKRTTEELGQICRCYTFIPSFIYTICLDLTIIVDNK